MLGEWERLVHSFAHVLELVTQLEHRSECCIVGTMERGVHFSAQPLAFVTPPKPHMGGCRRAGMREREVHPSAKFPVLVT